MKKPAHRPVNIAVSGTLNNINRHRTAVRTGQARRQTFTIFNKPVVNGVALTVTGANVLEQTNSAVEGTIAAALATAKQSHHQVSISDTLTLSCADQTGCRLQAQNNAIGVGIGTESAVIAGSANANQNQPIKSGQWVVRSSADLRRSRALAGNPAQRRSCFPSARSWRSADV